MKKLSIILLCVLVVCVFAGCQPDNPPQLPIDKDYYVSYFYNYLDNVDLSSDRVAEGDKLYKSEKITVGSPITKPQDPTREGYLFDGWYTESACTVAYDFTKTTTTKNITLYAKWLRDSSSDVGNTTDYKDANLTFVEGILDSGEALLWTSVLNCPINNGSVYLTTGGILRLETNATNVKELLGYSKLSSTTVVGATYDKTAKTITVSYTDNGQAKTATCTVVDNSNEYKVSNSSHETNASNYEKNSAAQTNYRIMLAGSSSMQYWTSSAEDLYPMLSINHGIGGTSAIQWRDDLAERLIYPYNPRAVALYVGVNDIINNGQTGESTGNVVVQLLQQIHSRLPNATVYYVLINSLPGYGRFQTEFDRANEIVTEFAELNEWAHVIDAGAGLMKDSGKPNSAYFRTDGLHMSTYGYTIWGQTIKDYIFNVEKVIYK